MGVYPVSENEENPESKRLCPRLEGLLDPSLKLQVSILVSNRSDGQPFVFISQ